MKKCFICEKYYEKGISICCSRQCHNKRINTRDRSNDAHVLRKMKKISDYNSNPQKCNRLGCFNTLSYEQKIGGTKFCSSSCSAIVNNSQRDHKSRKKQGKSLSETMKIKFPKQKENRISKKEIRCPVFFNQCKTCTKLFTARHSSKHYCSDNCITNAPIKVYRLACKFKITKATNPELFNIELLETFGWYRAANHKDGYNPDGATWDHLFRISDGYKLGVSPAIMSHPANAEMINWKENMSRKHSQITYEELLERIKLFEKK